MKRIIVSIILSASVLLPPSLAAAQENEEGSGKEVYTGTFVNTSGRMRTVGFTLQITRKTSDEEARNYLAILADQGQEGLMKAIRKNNLGYIAATGQTRRDLLLVREATINGKRRIIAAFERWQGFWEVRGGYRSLDYAFSIIEIFFDEKGKGSGTFIGLAEVKLEPDKKSGQMRLELESFGSFPSKVMGVIRR